MDQYITTSIQLYAENVTIEHEPTQNNVIVSGIDASQVLAEFSNKELLESVPDDVIYDYLREKAEDDNE